MPQLYKKISPWIITAILLLSAGVNPLYAKPFYGITTYYIRFDMKSSNHKISQDRLTMVPAENDYRPEIFSRVFVSHVLAAGPWKSNHLLEKLVKRQAFIRILEQKGLKSVHTMNNNTLISYEGMVVTPVDMQIGPYDENLGGYPYTAHIDFAPLAFPDEWESLRQKFKIKEILNDFFLLFK